MTKQNEAQSPEGGIGAVMTEGAGIGMPRDGMAAEQAFMDAASAQMQDILDTDDAEDAEEPRRRRKSEAVAEEPKDDGFDDEAGDDEVDEPDQDADDQTADDDDTDEDQDETGPKISVRKDGKKATLEDILPDLTVTIRVNGEDLEVDGEELIKGYQRAQDYQRKTTEIKGIREEILPYQQMVSFAKHDPQFLSYVQSYFQNGPYPELATNPDLKVSDAQLSAMLDQNSEGYNPDHANAVLRARADWTNKSQERQRVMQAAQQDMMASFDQWKQAQIETARQQINAMGDPLAEDGSGDYERKGESVLAFLHKSGFNDAEISGHQMLNSQDARLAILAFKAAEFERLKQETEAPRVSIGKKRKRNAPPRSQAPGSGTRTASNRSRVRDTAARAIKTQTSDDWISAIAQRVKL